jgi:asparagine synthase (glutamine-hydrolysing)
MCGFTVIWNFDGRKINPEVLVSMNNIIRHRGPDDEGFFIADTLSGNAGSFHGDDTLPEIRAVTPHISQAMVGDLAMGFRRLSIIDLSANGHQPMCDVSERWWIVFNGEIYNYPELRQELMAEGITFLSGSDTEVILYAYQKWGEDCVSHFNGMWAFVIYDKLEKKMFCSRDRFGIKPFYYIYEPGKLFACASEIKALLHLIPFEPEIPMIRDYFVTGVTAHTEHTFFNGISQLRAGHSLRLTNGRFHCESWYQPNPLENHLSFGEACEEFRHLLGDSVRLRQRSDVPYGYALSGGIDSSSIVCAARELSPGNSNTTFSLVFPGRKEDESKYIKSVIDHTGFRSEFVTIGPDDLANDLEKFAFHQEEPFGGISYYGEFKLRELIRNSGVTVSLEGQGADEIITGYSSTLPYYFYDLIRQLKFVQLSKEVGAFNTMTGLTMKQVMRSFASFLLKRKSRVHLQKYPFLNPEFLKDQGTVGFSEMNFPRSGSFLTSELNKLLFVTSIPEQLLRADKSAMAFSVESRFPFLDYRLVEFAMGLPYHFKTGNGTTKLILREAMKQSLPAKIYNRKDKIGFAVPASQWINPALWEKLSEYMDSNAWNEIIDKAAFKRKYPDKESVDWKFWKTISLIVWKKEFESVNKKSLLT